MSRTFGSSVATSTYNYVKLLYKAVQFGKILFAPADAGSVIGASVRFGDGERMRARLARGGMRNWGIEHVL